MPEDCYAYRISGLSVVSDLVLPGLAEVGDGTGTAVTIRAAAVPETLDDAAERGPSWEFAADRFLLCIPGLARFLLTRGREITYEPLPGVPREELAIFVLGTVFGILLHQRDQITLHASAVLVGGKAVLFCGPSGAGKSTMAAALGQRGYPLITDDVCAIVFDPDGRALIQPDGRQLKLWTQAIERLDLAAARGDAVRHRFEKFYVEPDQAVPHAVPVGAIYALAEARPPDAPGIEQPNLVDAALIFRRNAYRPLLVRRMRQKSAYFQAAASVAAAAGIFRLTRPLDFARLPEVIGWLEQHWREIGLAPAAP
jgi:hypothetical protein